MLEQENYELFFCYDLKNFLCGLIIIMSGPFDTDIIYIFVDSRQRRMGVANFLLKSIFNYLKTEKKKEKVFLEVSSMNKKAILLYEKIGMNLISKKRFYYKNGSDVLIYCYKLF